MEGIDLSLGNLEFNDIVFHYQKHLKTGHGDILRHSVANVIKKPYHYLHLSIYISKFIAL